ncbi:MAG: bifunctional hydroxymethylpyrimidine kinase/phosphomethylpyrimidine kinase [Clostridia bacterium]|nr:bifunctional hydroxymethylpyrimidine kinase/phosphomethylpyrimidine kinase [Clostridia bacterium]
MIKGAIFDLDGTLFDSMFVWDTIGEIYLRSIGYEPKENLNETFKTMSLYNAACYYKSEYGVTLSVDEIMDGVNRMVEKYYINEVQLKTGVYDFIKHLHNIGVKMCIATATDKYLVEAALERCGIKECFSEIFTCTSVGHSKDEPDIYREALRHLATPKEDTFVFEDAIYAIRTAKKDGFRVVAIYDKSEENQAEIKSLCDYYITDYTDMQGFWKFAAPMKTALSIAGSDCSGGAGIQADIKTMTMNGVYAMSAITALTAQNTMGVFAISESSPEFLKEQIDAVFEDIYPDAVKIGMVSSSELISVIAERLKFYNAKNIVVDPVMVATSGSELMKTDAVQTLIEELLPIATVVTPNIPEAEVLSGEKIQSKENMLNVAKLIGDKYGCAVLLKGGHSINDANDLLYANGEAVWFEGKRINNPNTHGTGCTLSSAIASNLAKGFNLAMSVKRAKAYISDALSAQLDLGQGSGPMMHNFDLQGEYVKEAE